MKMIAICKSKFTKSLFLLLVLLSFPALASVKSSSILFSQNKMRIISANFDAGSVSLIDAKSGALLKEAHIGKDIRRIALTADGRLLLATDQLNDQIVLLDAKTLKTKHISKVASRPFGVVFDALNQQFYVTSFERGQLLVINREGQVTQSIKTAGTPRGLAITDDGRLLVTHALLGQISIFDVTTKQPVLQKIIQLQDSAFDAVLSNPQGKPRLLDNIVISPDGTQAWLPHVLWSFAHNFQFQSTVFPSISILDLSVGNEHEIVDERKQLFKQINIIESGNRMRIISNPHDGAFTQDGKKVIFTLAGSEDLLIFDLSRQGKKNKKRHRRKKFQGGVKATQIYRNIPGDNPRGLLINGRGLWVQNAMSLDLVKFDTGAVGPFAKVKLRQAHFASLVKKDPLPKQLRRGKTLFNRANMSDDPNFSMAGDFWMSCNSCHLDGFNFTNKQLMADAKKDRFKNAITGHVDVRKMIAGDVVGAYIDIIQKTQGGMGGDPREGKLPAVSIENPPIEVVKMMSALNEYVRSSENLPYLSTWLRLDDKKRYTHPKEWINSAECAECHSTIFEQWADSNHGMKMDHPYYRFQEDFAAKEEGEEFRVLCRGCHGPQMVINNDVKALSGFGDMHGKGGQALKDALAQGKAVSERGTGCVFCHRITKAENAGGNTDMTVNIKDRDSYIFENSSNKLLKWLSEKQINSLPKAHKDSYTNKDLYNSSLYCATCHNEFTTGGGANVNDNFGEWLASPFNDPAHPENNKTCIDCHMTQDVTNFNNKVGGQSTNDGPIKSNLRSHHFVGW